MKKPRRDRDRSRRLTPKKHLRFDSPQIIGMLLHSLSPQIEAAGDFDRAVRLGLIGGEDAQLAKVKALVPVSRGGTLTHPDADKDWADLVAGAIAERGTDMEALRQACTEIEAGE